MATRVLATLLLIAFSGTASAQPQEGWAFKLLAENGKPPVATAHDFGTVPKGAMLPHRYPITNIYAVPLTISTRVSCDCVTITVPTVTVKPRETGSLDVAMDTRRFSGPKVVNIFFTVSSQQGFTSTAVLTVQANCRTDVTLNPGIVNFGLVPRGQAATKSVDVDYAGQLAWQILPDPIKSDLFDVAVKKRPTVAGRVGYTVDLKLKADAPAGSHKQELMLPTNDPQSPLVPVPFEVTVQSPYAVSPENYKLNTARVGIDSPMKFTVRGSANRPFKISSIEGLGDGLDLAEPLSADAKTLHLISLKYKPGVAGPIQKKFTVRVEGEKDPVATVAVEGTAS